MRKVFCLLVLAQMSALWAAQVEELSVRSPSMDKCIPVGVVLPDGYVTGGNRFPVVYYVHGVSGAWNTFIAPNVKDLADEHRVIFVFPDGGYSSWWWDSPVDPKCCYETFVIRELMPFVEARYRIDARREKRAILGESMGGHGACWLGFRHKDLFGAVGSIFGGVDFRPFNNPCWDIEKRLGPRDGNENVWERYTAIHEAGRLSNRDVALIMMIGTDDFFLGVNRTMHDLLAKNKVEHTYIECRNDSCGHTHEFHAYSMPVILRFFDNFFKTGEGRL